MEARFQRIGYSGSTERGHETWEKERLGSLRAESNFSLAVVFFKAVLCTGRNAQLAFVHHTNLIRSCAYHNSVEGAIHVFEQLERRKDLLPHSREYRFVLHVFTNAGNFQGAEENFKDFRQAGKEHRLAWVSSLRPLTGCWFQTMQTCNQTYFRADLPEKAVGIQMKCLLPRLGRVPCPATSLPQLHRRVQLS